jgi:hypothetical protein
MPSVRKTKTLTGPNVYKRGNTNASEEWQVEWYDRVPKVAKTTVRGADAHFSIKDAGLNTPQSGTAGARDRVANPKGRRVT